MSYQDAIAGFGQLHQAFRENADRKQRQVELLLEQRFRAEEAAKQRGHEVGQTERQIAGQIKQTGMEIGFRKERMERVEIPTARAAARSQAKQDWREEVKLQLSAEEEARRQELFERDREEYESRKKAMDLAISEFGKSKVGQTEMGQMALSISGLLAPENQAKLFMELQAAESEKDIRTSLAKASKQGWFTGVDREELTRMGVSEGVFAPEKLLGTTPSGEQKEIKSFVDTASMEGMFAPSFSERGQMYKFLRTPAGRSISNHLTSPDFVGSGGEAYQALYEGFDRWKSSRSKLETMTPDTPLMQMMKSLFGSEGGK